MSNFLKDNIALLFPLCCICLSLSLSLDFLFLSMQACFPDICFKPTSPPSNLSKLTIYALFTSSVFCLCLSTFVFFTLTSILSQLLLCNTITWFSFLLNACYHVVHLSFTLILLPSKPAVSLINLYHSLGNCLTFTSCIWGTCAGKWNEM